MTNNQSIVSIAADKLANKIYDGIQFFFQTKIDALTDILPELLGLGIIVCGIMMMFGDLQKWIGRTAIVAIVGTGLVVLL